MGITTNYSSEADLGVPGALAYMGNSERHTFTAESAFGFGKGLVFGTGGKVKIASLAGQKFVGISGFQHSIETEVGYVENDPAIVVRKGAVFMTAVGACNEGVAVYIDVATGDATEVITDNIATGGIFRSTALDGEVVIVDINQPAGV